MFKFWKRITGAVTGAVAFAAGVTTYFATLAAAKIVHCLVAIGGSMAAGIGILIIVGCACAGVGAGVGGMF